jgi:hypothetical protein
MVDYGGALKKPFQDITKLVIGIVLSIIPIVNFLAIGYYIEIAKKTLAKDNNLPEWTNWGGLFVQGIISIVIAIIYMIPAIIIMVLAAAPLIGIAISAATTGADPTAALSGALATAGVLLLVGLLVLLITVFLLPMALIFYAKDGFGGAFKFGAIIKACLTGNYIISWIIVIVISIILTMILGLIPIIGFAIASFYLGVFEYSVFAQVLSEQKGK